MYIHPDSKYEAIAAALNAELEKLAVDMRVYPAQESPTLFDMEKINPFANEEGWYLQPYRGTKEYLYPFRLPVFEHPANAARLLSVLIDYAEERFRDGKLVSQSIN